MSDKIESLTQMVILKSQQRSAQIASVLEDFVQHPGSLTCYQAEKRLHELLRALGDDIFSEVLPGVIADKNLEQSAVEKASKKNSVSMTENG